MPALFAQIFLSNYLLRTFGTYIRLPVSQSQLSACPVVPVAWSYVFSYSPGQTEDH